MVENCTVNNVLKKQLETDRFLVVNENVLKSREMLGDTWKAITHQRSSLYQLLVIVFHLLKLIC